LLNNLGQWALRIPKNTKNAIIPGNLNVGSLAISSTKNCEKIYTDASGNIKCGTDSINPQIVSNSRPWYYYASASCPSGKKVVGGGCNCVKGLVDSYPTSSGWYCLCDSYCGGSSCATAYAICI
ncbi:MAG: hypothetical protein ABFQ65_04765, partial [Nanoarchaeota archaeon]